MQYSQNKRIVAIIQARMGSTRLPGKVLKDLAGKPVIWHIVQRVRQVGIIDSIVVATTTQPEDDVLAAYLEKEGIPCFRGDNDDVLKRYYCTAKEYDAQTVIRITGDNPLIDPDILEQLITVYCRENHPYASTKDYPLGLGGEIFSFEALENAYYQANQPYEREHVTPYMYREGNQIGLLYSPTDLSNYRFTMDTEEDYLFMSRVYATLFKGDHDFRLSDIIAFLSENPDILKINKDVHQKKLGE